jgi:mediator of RNA polymerase II transcription subunit 25
MGKKECRATVVALSQNAVECRADTWPSQLTLVPTPDPAVSPAELREWVARFKPVICRFQPKSEAGDLTNEQYYKSLIQLLITKRVFAVAGWTLPSGAQENNVLIFPTNDQVLLGAFFPLTGMPEIPKARPASLQSLASRHGPEFLAQLQRLSPEQRNFVIARMLQRSNPHPGGSQAQSGLTAAQLRMLQAQNMVQAKPHSSPENSGFGSPELVAGSSNTADPIHNSRLLHQLSHMGGLDGAPLHRAQNDFQSGHQT